MNRFERKRDRGFSLVELLVVIIVLGGIMSIVLPRVIGADDRAKWNTAKNQIIRINGEIERFYTDNERYPQSMQELIEKPGDAPFWSGPYVQSSLLKDPWGKEWIFNLPGEKGDFDIITYAKDGVQGGEGVNQDLSNWD